jgi:hypothetical protein
VVTQLSSQLAWLDRPSRALAVSAAVFAVPILFVLLVPHPLEQRIGVDYELYRDVASRWLAGGSYFEPYQLAGPYEIRPGDVLYPPVELWLFVPFAAVSNVAWPVASVLWWLVPGAIVVACVMALRPRPLVWPLIALCLSNPTTLLKIWTGNPVIWSMAAMALAVVGSSRFAAPFVLLKPSLAPFALFGIRHRSWWAGAAALAVLSIPFGPLWLDWVASVVNSRGGGLLYSALEVPILALPLAAWVGRRAGGGSSGPGPAESLAREPARLP